MAATQPTERRHHPIHRVHEGGQRGGADQPEGAAQSTHPRGIRIGQDAQIRLLGDREHEHRRGRGIEDRGIGAQRSRYHSSLLRNTRPTNLQNCDDLFSTGKDRIVRRQIHGYLQRGREIALPGRWSTRAGSDVESARRRSPVERQTAPIARRIPVHQGGGPHRRRGVLLLR